MIALVFNSSECHLLPSIHNAPYMNASNSYIIDGPIYNNFWLKSVYNKINVWATGKVGKIN
jgi:hypothetical protein